MRHDYRTTPQGKRRFAHPLIYRLTAWLGKALWFIGIALHNPYSGECTPDFNCCNPIGRRAWLRRCPNNKPVKCDECGKVVSSIQTARTPGGRRVCQDHWEDAQA